MPVRGLFDFDGLPVLMPGEDFFGRQVFPLVETANNGAEPLAGPFGGSDEANTPADLPSHNLLGGLFGGDDTSEAPASINLLDSLFGGGNETPSETPSTPGGLGWLFGLLSGGGDDTPSPTPEPGEAGYWLTVGLFGGRVWAAAEPEAADELNSMVVCPADHPIAEGNALPGADLFGNI